MVKEDFKNRIRAIVKQVYKAQSKIDLDVPKTDISLDLDKFPILAKFPTLRDAIVQLLTTQYKDFVSEIISDEYRLKQERFQDIQEKALQESAWIQLLMTLKFWLDDTSAAFEKTDIYIEKSVKASFELMNTAPLESLIDFGKFLFKEKIQHN